MTYIRLPEEASDVWPTPSVSIEGGPTRVHYDAQPDPNYRPRTAGFTADQTTTSDTEPLLWDGDNA